LSGGGEERLRGALGESLGVSWTAPIEHVETASSTSDLMKDRARSGAPEWSCVFADSQTAGRGRLGRTWVSPPGNLFLSLLLRPKAEFTLIPLLAGVAVGEALEGLGLPTLLKWPNDVLARGRKMAGILAEGIQGPAGMEGVVLGLGVNLNLDPHDLGPEIAGHTTSFRAETGRTEDPVLVAAAVLARLFVWYDALTHGNPEGVLMAWRSRSVRWWGRGVEVRSGDRVICGVARDVNREGALVVEVSGTPLAVLSGEARELRLSGA
jgi:BirA family biotin operon repressor/biotin-[acetyl-CoA-carboxylase] ligase